MFTAFGGIKKREPLFTFKRKVPFSHTAIEDSNKKVVSLPSPSSSSNSSVELLQPKEAPKEPDIDDAIFDFPAKIDKKALEIKLMVASTERRTVPDTKLVKKKSKQKLTKPSPSPSCSSSTSSSPVQKTKKKSPKKQIKPPVPSSYEPSFDIFAFDPQPSSHLPHYTPTSHTNMLYHYQQPQPMYSANMNVNNILNDPLGLNDVASLLDSDPAMPFFNNTPFPNTISSQSFNHTNTLPHTFPFEDTSLNKTSLPQEPAEKKRKRNLVAHLKSANGEKENKPLNQDFDFLLSDDDEEPKDILPLRDIITTRDKSPSPELSYQQKMELELEAMMRSEFGTKEKVEQEAISRPRYQPLNKLNVKVTFQKKK